MSYTLCEKSAARVWQPNPIFLGVPRSSKGSESQMDMFWKGKNWEEYDEKVFKLIQLQCKWRELYNGHGYRLKCSNFAGFSNFLPIKLERFLQFLYQLFHILYWNIERSFTKNRFDLRPQKNTYFGPIFSTNTKSLAKEFTKILIFEYFRYLKIVVDVFFDADSKSPRMT